MYISNTMICSHQLKALGDTVHFTLFTIGELLHLNRQKQALAILAQRGT